MADDADRGGAPAVVLSDVVKRFGRQIAVDRLSMTVHRGSVVALLGPNGAGKTTTIDICSGFQAANTGEVLVLGRDPLRAGESLRQRVGVMPQGGGAYPGVHAGEMLALVAACARRPLDQRWLLDILGLTSVGRTPYKRLSVGQRQRLSLACAIVTRPELVFLDEPTAGLDPQARRLVWELIDALRRDGMTVVLTTHFMEEAQSLADQVVIIDRGQALVRGTPEEVTAARTKPLLAFQARSGLDLCQLNRALPESCHATEAEPRQYRVDGVITPEVLAAVMAWCAEQGVLAESVRVAKPTLEEVFLELTGRALR